MPKSVDLHIDGYIGKDTVMSIFGGEQSFGLSNLNSFLSELEKDVTDIVVHINSGGGSVDEGFAIHDKLKSIPYNIVTIAEGMVGSIATIIYMAGQTRKMFENSKFFIHNPYYSPSGPEAIEAKDAKKLAEELQAEEDRILNFYANQTGKAIDVIKPFMDAQTSFTSQEAIDMGFVTEIVKKETQNKKQYQLVAFTKSINTDMKDTQMNKADQLSWFKKIENLVKNFKNETTEVVNAVIKTKDGAEIHFDGELKEGAKLFTDANMATPVADGTLETETQKIEVAGGVVTKLEEVKADEPNAEVIALQTANNDLTAKIATLEASIEANKIEAAKKAEIVNELNTEIVAMKKVFIGAENAPVATTQNFKASAKAEDRFAGIKKNLVNKYAKK